MPQPQSAGASADSTGPVRLLRSHQLSQSVPYAYAATTDEPGRLLFTAGACPLDAEGHTVAPGDVTAQAQQVMVDLRTTLAEADADLTCVVRSTVYVATTDRADLDAAWSVVAAPSASTTPPARCQESRPGLARPARRGRGRRRPSRQPSAWLTRTAPP